MAVTRFLKSELVAIVACLFYGLTSCGKDTPPSAPKTLVATPKSSDATATPAPVVADPLLPPANASLTGLPDLASNQSRLEIAVAGEGIKEYKFSVSLREGSDCKKAKYSDWIDAAQPLIVEITEVGEQRLCVVGRNGKKSEQSTPSEHVWNYAPLQNSVTLVSLQIEPAEVSIIQGLDKQLIAMGKFSDVSTADLSRDAVWSSPAENIVSVKTSGKPAGTASGVEAGSVTISARFGEFSSLSKVTVVVAKLTAISITPVNPTIAAGTSVALKATGAFDNNTTQDLTKAVTWSTADSRLVGVTDGGANTGLAVGVLKGAANVSATMGTIRGMTRVTVSDAVLQSIQVTPAASTAVVGTAPQLTATGTYSDGTKQNLTATATWTSSNVAMATVNDVAPSKGIVTARAAGTPTISARVGTITGTTTITIVAATLSSITVTPAASTMFAGATLQYKAVGTYTNNTTQDITATATWSTSVAAKATVSNVAATKGLVSGLAAGTVTVTATLGSVNGSTGLTVSAVSLTSIRVTPATASLVAGTQRQLVATGVYNNNTTSDLTATVQWLSSNTTLVTVSSAAPSQGIVSAVAAGSATITARMGTISGTATMTVTAAPPATPAQ